MKEEETDTKDENATEVPMLHLASFALHKLFTEWQSEGFEIPDFKIGSHGTPVEGSADPEVLPTAAPVVPIKTQVPDNANTLHPTTLLCMVSAVLPPKTTNQNQNLTSLHLLIFLLQMRPGTKYVDLGTEGKSPNVSHSVGVDVDGSHFIGRAKNKKLARKLAARDACNALFGTQYPMDESELASIGVQVLPQPMTV